MNIKRAKEEIEHTVKAYLAKDALGEYAIPAIRQRPILLMGPPGIGKTQVMEQVARECGVALVAYTITHHTRQSAVGLPFIRQRHYGDKDVSADAEAKVVDAVAYEGLKAGEEYELSATLVDKATGEPVADASGMPVGAKAQFAPALSTGSRDVEISFDASLLGGRDLVVFESLRKDGAEVASHADLSDEGQTVHVAVEVGTQAADAVDGDQVIEAGKAKVVDTVAYKGLVPGETYIAVGTLMDKGTGEPFLDKDGNEVTARTPFEPEAPSGTVEVTFEFDTEGLAEGDELVVFEKVLDSAGNVVAAHEDIDSAEQSVVVDNPDTPEVPEEPYAKTGADAPDGTGYAAAAGIALAAAAGAGGALAYRKRKAAASKDAAAEEPDKEPEE